ncbi:RH42 [Scenedesmus sp. PABB004]|nr:RH42 [Scenedesmus sp. PABB004]
MSKDRSRERGRSHHERERSRERSKHTSSRHRDRSRDRDRERRRRSRSRSHSRGRERSSRHRSRDRSRSRSPGDDDGRKRRRTDEERGAPPAPAQQPSPQQQLPHGAPAAAQSQQQQQQQQQHALQQQAALTEEEREAAHKKKRQDEQDALDAEMEVRRQRVEEWRRKRAAEAAAAEQERKAAEEAAAAAASAKGWSLEDDDEDEDGHAHAGDEDEEDPLDAFMAGNAAAAAPAAEQQQQQQQQQPAQAAQPAGDADMADAEQQGAAGGGGEGGGDDNDEVDPLDAFMANQVLPEVAKVRWSVPDAAGEAAPGAGGGGGEGGGAAAPAGGGGGGAAPGGSRPATPSSSKRGPAASGARAKAKRRFYSSDESSDERDSDDSGEEEAELDDAAWAKAVTAGKLSKGDKLLAVDHAAVTYPPFRRAFYIEVPEIKRMTEPEVAALRKELDGIKVRGKNPPRPIKAWTQSGLSGRVLDILRRNGFDRPLAIQAQAVPIIMSGRDCIGIAKTGSGKTLAFVLPMLRHIKDQPPLANGDGPVALIMAPTRELVQQISKEVKRFGRAVGLTSVAVFGGSGVANQISELKRGAEVVAATPGRLIDLLVNGGGKITNLRRVTYLVLDEADRMFDMGFEPQIMRIVGNIRPDRQCVMFSATFPRSVEALARQVLKDPVEIQVGGRSVVNADIAQFVEIRPEAERWLRLLEVLGEWYEAGKIIIFVHTQDKADNLFRDLLKAGYPCLSLHGGKDQSDRECTIGDFKGGVCNILVATSVAARGLDVRELVLVVNYDAPNHHEDYVHRVGRTGRAGNKGTAVTFIGPDEERYAPDLVKALRESGAAVPQDLQALADSFTAKRKAGLVQGHGSGFGGSGFKFDKDEDSLVKAARKSKAKEFGIVVEDGEDGDDDRDKLPGLGDDDDNIRPAGTSAAAAAAGAGGGAGLPLITPVPITSVAVPGLAAAPAANGLPGAPAPGVAAPALLGAPGAPPPGPLGIVEAAKAAAALASGLPPPGALGMPPPGPLGMPPPGPPGAPAGGGIAAMMRAAAAAAAAAGGAPPPGAMLAPLGAAGAAAAAAPPPAPRGYEAEIEINDFPQTARWKVTHKGFQADLTELTGAAVTTKGLYIKSGEPPEGERKLYLLIEAPTEAQVRRAKQEIRRAVEEGVEKAMRRETGAGGRYTIV